MRSKLASWHANDSVLLDFFTNAGTRSDYSFTLLLTILPFTSFTENFKTLRKRQEKDLASVRSAQMFRFTCTHRDTMTSIWVLAVQKHGDNFRLSPSPHMKGQTSRLTYRLCTSCAKFNATLTLCLQWNARGT